MESGNYISMPLTFQLATADAIIIFHAKCLPAFFSSLLFRFFVFASDVFVFKCVYIHTHSVIMHCLLLQHFWLNNNSCVCYDSVQGKQLLGISHSPKNKTTGFSVISGQGSPSESNRWFKREMDAPSSLRSIQIEEKAIKDLKRFYSNVRIVKNQS